MEQLKSKKVCAGIFCGKFCSIVNVLMMITSTFIPFWFILLDNYSCNETLKNGYQHGAVASDSPVCSKIGVEILKKNGSAVDSAIATLFCIGVHNFHLAGIGGGGFLMYYNESMKQTFAIDFREKAPQVIPEKVMKIFKNDRNSTKRGGLSICVPGQVKGLYEAHQQFGHLSWSELIQPSIELAEKGVKILPSMPKYIKRKIVYSGLMNGDYANLKQLLISPNGEVLTEGNTLKQPELALTLRAIAEEGPDYFYNSNFTKKLVKDLREQYNSILTFEDFKTYTAVTRPVLMSRFDDDMTIHSFPPPASGAVLALILNILDNGYLQTGINLRAEAYHRIVEAFKFGFGQHMFLGDPDFNDTINEVVKYMMDVKTSKLMQGKINDTTTYNETYYLKNLQYNPPSLGTTHVCVLDEHGDGVAITSSINFYFGSFVLLNGVLFNNHMRVFNIPGRHNSYGYHPARSNYLKGGDRPLSEAVPTIITKNGKIVMIIGASGGKRIVTSIAQVILNVFKFGMSLNESVSSPRLHHELIPNVVRVEKDFPESYIKRLREWHHDVNVSYNKTLGVVQAIYKNNGMIYAVCDKRRDGQPAGY